MRGAVIFYMYGTILSRYFFCNVNPVSPEPLFLFMVPGVPQFAVGNAVQPAFRLFFQNRKKCDIINVSSITAFRKLLLPATVCSCEYRPHRSAYDPRCGKCFGNGDDHSSGYDNAYGSRCLYCTSDNRAFPVFSEISENSYDDRCGKRMIQNALFCVKEVQ